MPALHSFVDMSPSDCRKRKLGDNDRSVLAFCSVFSLLQVSSLLLFLDLHFCRISRPLPHHKAAARWLSSFCVYMCMFMCLLTLWWSCEMPSRQLFYILQLQPSNNTTTQTTISENYLRKKTISLLCHLASKHILRVLQLPGPAFLPPVWCRCASC